MHNGTMNNESSDTLLSLLKSRDKYAKKFSKDYHERVKREVKDYYADDDWLSTYTRDNKLYLQVVKRYEIIIPLIFTQHEGMLSSMFDRVPGLIINQRGALDEEKAKKIEASYEYLKDKLRLEQFMNTAAWWYLLTGFVSSHGGYVKKAKEIPIYDEMGEPMIGEDGEPITTLDYEIDDPELTVDGPEETFFAPDSEYDISANRVPYYTREKLMTVDQVYKTYGVILEPDASLEIKDGDTVEKDKAQETSDLGRVKVHFYYGQIPMKYEDRVLEQGLEYDMDGWYYFVFTGKRVLHGERVVDDMKTCKILKWYGSPDKFYGFGLAKILQPFQKEKSLRRTQQARYADVAAFPKLLIPIDSEVDMDALADPREVPFVLYDQNNGEPKFMSPPDMSNTLVMAEQSADRDAQQASGMMDISQGQQSSSTVDTATGQAIFAEAAEKRIRYAKKNFMEFYLQNVVMLLKLAQLYWDSEKVVSITDDQGNTEEISVSSQDLSDIDFDTDISIDPDSLTINKDVLRQQAIELYNISKDDPLVDRRQLFMNMLRIGFDTKNPEKYIKEMDVQPGTQLQDVMTGQVYTVDETGELVSQQEQMQMADPTGDMGQVSSSPSGVMGASQQI